MNKKIQIHTKRQALHTGIQQRQPGSSLSATWEQPGSNLGAVKRIYSLLLYPYLQGLRLLLTGKPTGAPFVFHSANAVWLMDDRSRAYPSEE